MANKPITEIEGIGEAMATKLAADGVDDTDTLLEKGKTKKGRQEISEKCDLSEKLVLKWVNMADLFRVKGVGQEYSELLERSGVDTVKELRNRNAANLTAKMAEVNEEKSLVRALPSESVVAGWIEHAKTLDPMVEY